MFRWPFYAEERIVWREAEIRRSSQLAEQWTWENVYSILPHRIGCIDTLSLRVQTCKGNLHSLRFWFLFHSVVKVTNNLGTNNHCLHTSSPRKRKLTFLNYLTASGDKCLNNYFNIILISPRSYKCPLSKISPFIIPFFFFSGQVTSSSFIWLV